MGNSQCKFKCNCNKSKVVNRTIKFCLIAPYLEIVIAVIKKAPNAVIGAISSVSLDCGQGAVQIPPQLLPRCRHHNHDFNYLVNSTKYISFKRHLIFEKKWCVSYHCIIVSNSSWVNRSEIYIEAYAQKIPVVFPKLF